MLDILGTLIASAIPIGTTAWVAVRAGRANARFFDALVAARGPLPRTELWSRIGLGNNVIGTFDYVPGLVALGRRFGDEVLDSYRQVARRWTYAFYVELPVALGVAVGVSQLLNVTREVPMAVAFASWVFFQYLPAGHLLWASRPDAREDMTLGTHAYALVGLVVVVTLGAAFGLVAILLLISGAGRP